MCSGGSRRQEALPDILQAKLVSRVLVTPVNPREEAGSRAAAINPHLDALVYGMICKRFELCTYLPERRG